MARKAVVPGFEDVTEKKRRFRPRAGDLGYLYNLGGFEELPDKEDILGPNMPPVEKGGWLATKGDLDEAFLKQLGSPDPTTTMTTTPQTVDPKDFESSRLITNPASYFTLDSLGKEMSKLHETQQTASGYAARFMESSPSPGISGLGNSLFNSGDVSELTQKYKDEGIGDREATRRAWDETDMFSMSVNLAWVFDWEGMKFIADKAPLFGDTAFGPLSSVYALSSEAARKIGSIDLGTKGFMEEVVMDPLNAYGLGKILKWGGDGLLRGGGMIYNGLFTPSTVIPSTGSVPAHLAGKKIFVSGGSQELDNVIVYAPPKNNPTKLEMVKLGFTPTEKLWNFMGKYTSLINTTDGQAKQIIDSAAAARARGDNLSTSISSEFDYTYRQLFTVNKDGTVDGFINIDSQIPGNPTIADIAARLPRYWDHLSTEQKAFMKNMRERLDTWEQSMIELGIPPNKRFDIVTSELNPNSNGFYLSRGGAYKKGDIDSGTKTKVGGRKAFEKAAAFDSQAQGIDKGYTYEPFKDATQSYLKGSSDRVAEQWSNNALLSLTDEFGKPLHSTPAMRLIDNKVTNQVRSIRNSLRSKRITLIRRNVRKAEKEKISEKALKEAQKELDAENARIQVVKDKSVDRLAPVMDRVIAAEKKVVEAGGYVRDDLVDVRRRVNMNINDARKIAKEIQSNLNRLKLAKKKFGTVGRSIEKALKELQGLTDEAENIARTINDDVLQEMPTAAIGRKYEVLLRKIERLENKIDNMEQSKETLQTYMNARESAGEFYSSADDLTMQNYRSNRDELTAAAKKEQIFKRADRDLKTLEKEVNRTIKLLSKDEARQINSIQRSVSQATNRAIEYDDRTAAALRHVYETQKEMGELEDLLNSLKGEYNHARELAQNPPTGYANVEHSFALNHVAFPEEFAKTLSRNFEKEIPTTGKDKWISQIIRAHDGIFRQTRASGDDSAVAIHGLLGVFANPKATAKTFYRHWEAWGTNGEQVLGKFIVSYNDTALRNGRLTSEDWGRFELRQGGSETEFQIRGAGGRIQSLPFIKQANRAFGFYGDKLRLEWADDLLQEQLRSGKTIQELESSGKLKEIADGVNQATGWTDKPFGGSIGEFLFFAPKFLGARMANTGKALFATVTDPIGSVEALPVIGRATRQALEGKGVRDIPLDQRIARKSMLRLIGGAATLTYMTNFALGNETDARLIIQDKDGNWIFNTNFMKVPYKGTDYSFYGTYDSLARLLVMAGTGHAIDGFRGLASGTIQQMGNILFEADAVGRKTVADWMPGDNETIAKIGYLMQQYVPFSFEDIPEIATKAIGDVKEEGIAAGIRTGAEAFGVKNSPYSYRDWIREIFNEKKTAGEKSPSSFGDDLGWDLNNPSRGELNVVANDPRVKNYVDSLDIVKQGEPLAFDNLKQDLLNGENFLVDVLNSGADNLRIKEAIERVKMGRRWTFDAFINNKNNTEYVEAWENPDIKHQSDLLGHEYWSGGEYEEDPFTGFIDFEKEDLRRKKVLQKAFDVGGADLVRYITDPSTVNAENYRAQVFSDPRASQALIEYDADHQQFMRQYYQLPMELIDRMNMEKPEEFITEPDISEMYRAYLRLSPGQKDDVERQASYDLEAIRKEISRKEIEEIETAKYLHAAFKWVDEQKKGWRKAIFDPEGNVVNNWIVDAKMWKWGEAEPINPVTKSIYNYLEKQSKERGTIGTIRYSDVEPLIQGIVNYLEMNPGVRPDEGAAQYLNSLQQPAGVR